MVEGFLSIIDITAPSQANAGDTIPVSVTFKNTGANVDDFMWEAIDASTATVLGSGTFSNLPIDGQDIGSFSFLMPDKDITISVKTYHYESLEVVIFRQKWHPGELVSYDGNWIAIDLTGDGLLDGVGYDGYSSYKPLPENIIGYTAEGYPVYTRPGYEPTERVYVLEGNSGVIFKMSDPDAADAILNSESVPGYEDREVYAS